MIHDFTPVSAIFGGAVLGLAASVLLWTTGKVAGIAGIWGGIVEPVSTGRLTTGGSEVGWRLVFVLGLAAGAVLVLLGLPSAYAGPPGRSTWEVIGAGLLVGVGTRVGNGCTSGHGICGLSRYSVRSVVAVASFMAAGFAVATALGWLAAGAT